MQTWSSDCNKGRFPYPGSNRLGLLIIKITSEYLPWPRRDAFIDYIIYSSNTGIVYFGFTNILNANRYHTEHHCQHSLHFFPFHDFNLYLCQLCAGCTSRVCYGCSMYLISILIPSSSSSGRSRQLSSVMGSVLVLYLPYCKSVWSKVYLLGDLIQERFRHKQTIGKVDIQVSDSNLLNKWDMNRNGWIERNFGHRVLSPLRPSFGRVLLVQSPGLLGYKLTPCSLCY